MITQNQAQWVIYLTLLAIGSLGGFILGAWIVTRQEVISSAEKLLEEAG